MANGNPFYIQPAGATLGQAFAPIGQALVARGQEQKAEEKLAAQQAIYGNYMDAMYSGDYDAQRQIERDNPILIQQLNAIKQNQESALGGLESDIANDVLLGNMTGTQLFDKYGAQLQSIGQGELASQLPNLRPEQLKMLAIQNADPESYKRFRDSMSQSPSEKERAETRKLQAETRLLEQKFEQLGDKSMPADDKMKVEKDLRQEVFNRQKDFEKVDDAWSRVKVSADNPSPAGDLALIFNYMKMLDPGSTVREGEFATAQQAGGVDDVTLSLYNRIIDGTRLTETQRKDFTDRAKSLFGEARKKQDRLENKYKSLSKRYGVDFENVILKTPTEELSDEELLGKYL